MNDKGERSIEELYKRHIKFIGVLISFIIISIFVLVLVNINKNYKDSMLINILGRQRMLTQMMAKDVGRIYELNDMLKESSYDKERSNNIKNDIEFTIKELRESEDEYDKTLNLIEKGYLIADSKEISFKSDLNKLNPILMEHEKLWNSCKAAIDLVLKEYDNNTYFSQSVKYINNNNGMLLNYSDKILNEILRYNSNRSMSLYYTVLTFIIVMFIILSLFIKRAYRDLFIPISQLSRGVSRLGVETKQPKIIEANEINSMPVFSEVQEVFDQLNNLISLIANLNQNIPFKDILKYIFNTFSNYIPYTYIGVALIDDNGKSIKASYAVTGSYHQDLPKRILGTKVCLDRTSIKQIVQTGQERIINDLEQYVKGKPPKDYNKILLEEGIRSSITFPLKNDDAVIGIIFFSSKDKNVYKKEHIRFLKTLVSSITLSLDKNILLEDMVMSSTLALAKLTEERDSDTGEHLNRMKTYSKIIAELLSKEEKYKDIIDIDYINAIERFAPLHDIGKVAIRDEILLKPDKLTKEEFEVMKTHAAYGAKVLSMADENLKNRGMSIFKLAIEIAEGHHEKWDGSGYPYNKKGNDIPLSARIVALGDVFDALTSRRPYKEPFTFEESFKIVTEGSGKHFDPYIIDVFTRNIEVIRNTYLGFKESNAL